MQVRTESGINISVRALNDHDRPPRRFAPGRVCAEHDCDVHVSIYNASDYCSLHEAKITPRIRGKKVR